MQEKREHPRTPINTQVTCEFDAGEQVVGLARDISLGGMYVEANSVPAFGSKLAVVCQLPGNASESRLPAVVRWVKPGGFGYGSDDHKLLYNYKSLSKILEESGFVAHPLEYYDESGKFHFTDWNSEDGHVMRSMRYDKRFNEPLGYSSLIVDGIKK